MLSSLANMNDIASWVIQHSRANVFYIMITMPWEKAVRVAMNDFIISTIYLDSVTDVSNVVEWKIE